LLPTQEFGLSPQEIPDPIRDRIQSLPCKITLGCYPLQTSVLRLRNEPTGSAPHSTCCKPQQVSQPRLWWYTSLLPQFVPPTKETACQASFPNPIKYLFLTKLCCFAECSLRSHPLAAHLIVK
jgi:hypothetical protein